jgi:hypothetical protein
MPLAFGARGLGIRESRPDDRAYLLAVLRASA